MGLTEYGDAGTLAKLSPPPADSIVYIASYPRSGNTFARILLANYASAEDAPLPLDRLEHAIPADTSDFLWRRVPSGEVSARAHWSFRRQVIADYRAAPSPLPFRGLKTHTANLSAFGAPAFDIRPTDRVIYLVRHPLDVAISNADYNNDDIDSSIALMRRDGACVSGGTLASIEARGSWLEHVAGWLEAPCPVLTLRYEDLRSETGKSLRLMADFIGLEVRSDRIGHAVRAADFATLQRQEREGGFQEAPAHTRSGRFFREGRPGQWLTEMTREQALALGDYCAGPMRRFGYLDPAKVMRA